MKVSLTRNAKKPPLRWLLGISCDVAVLSLYFQRSKLGGLIWQVLKVVPEVGEPHAEASRDPSGATHFDGILAEQFFKVKGRGDHGKLTLRCARPLRFRAVPVKLDTIAVRVAEIERLADAMIGSAFERNVGENQATKGVG